MVSVLQNNLCVQFGLSACLTGSGLDYDNAAVFTVDSQLYNPELDVGKHSGVLERAIIERGLGGRSLGCVTFPLRSDSLESDEGVFLFGVLTKFPNNCHTYTLPSQLSHLQPVFEFIDKDFQKNVPFADTYYCGFMYRSLPLAKTQIADKWHVHKIFSRDNVTTDRVSGLEILQNTVNEMGGFCRDYSAIEYLISDKLGSYFQTASTQVPMNIIENPGDYISQSVPEKNSRQLLDSEMLRGSSYVYHRAADVPEEMVGEERTLLAVSYVPSVYTKNEFS